MANPRGTPETLKMFSSEYQPKTHGPKKSRLRSFIKENDLGTRDITVISRLLVDLPLEKIAELARDKTKPILLTNAAAALLKDIQRGKTDTVQWLIDRGFGQAKQVVENTNIEVRPEDLPPAERDKIAFEIARRMLNEEKNDSSKMQGSDDAAGGCPAGVPGEAEEDLQEKP
jgi:hypothetical protein